MKIKNRILCAAVAVCIGVSALPTAAFAVNAGDIPIDETHFPDSVFRDVVRQCDADANGWLSGAERNAPSDLYVPSMNITELKGIEYFPNIEDINCRNNFLHELDLSKNTALTGLDCSDNSLKAIDLSANTKLKILNCNTSRVAQLVLGVKPELVTVNCENNKLTALDLSGCTALKDLNCKANQFTALDLSKSASLSTLDCSRNKLKSLNIKNTAVSSVACSFNQLTDLSTAGTAKLTTLACDYNKLAKLDVSGSPNLETLDCKQNQLTAVDVSKNLKLKNFNCSNNRLTSLSLKGNTALVWAYYGGNSYTISIPWNRVYKISDLPGNFDVSKASEWQGATVKNGLLTVDEDEDTVTYKYNTGYGEPKPFKISVIELDPYPTMISFAKKSAELSVGRSLKLKATNKTGKKLKWKSSNPKVVSVSRAGKLTAKQIGTAKITAKANGYSAVIKVTAIPKAVKKFRVKKQGNKLTVTIQKANKKYQTYVQYRRSGSKAASYTLTKSSSYAVALAKGKYTIRAYSYVKKKGKVYKSKPSKAVKITIK